MMTVTKLFTAAPPCSIHTQPVSVLTTDENMSKFLALMTKHIEKEYSGYIQRECSKLVLYLYRNESNKVVIYRPEHDSTSISEAITEIRSRIRKEYHCQYRSIIDIINDEIAGCKVDSLKISNGRTEIKSDEGDTVVIHSSSFNAEHMIHSFKNAVGSKRDTSLRLTTENAISLMLQRCGYEIDGRHIVSFMRNVLMNQMSEGDIANKAIDNIQIHVVVNGYQNKSSTVVGCICGRIFTITFSDIKYLTFGIVKFINDNLASLNYNDRIKGVPCVNFTARGSYYDTHARVNGFVGDDVELLQHAIFKSSQIDKSFGMLHE